MTAQILAKKPTIKILLYTDDPNAITDGDNLLGLGSMVERLKAHAPRSADLSIKWVSRSSDLDHHADNKLDAVMRSEVEQTGEAFDEVWFFGLHQANTEKFSLGVFRGGPESELTADEIAALDKWMKVEGGSGGGVLMTGDHNNPIPPKWLRNRSDCSDGLADPELLGLGRAIGRCVPRAGELRKWEGPPSSRSSDSLNTLARSGFQTDRVPQKVIHELVNDHGEPDPTGLPHPIFFYRPGRFIDTLPDHRHEGALVIPDLSDTAVWPVGPNGQPKPCIVGFGKDRRSGQKIGLVTTYDGDRADVGRIVADSSWHHYVNINLKGFPHPSAVKTNSDKIGQFYGNLAIWLAPIHKRRKMAQFMFQELADYTLLLEQHDDPNRTGEIAYTVLGRSTSPCETHELLRCFGLQELVEDLANSEQEALGLVLDSYQKAMIRAEQETISMASIEVANIVSQGLTKAKAAAAAAGSGRVSTGSTRVRRKRAAALTTLESKEWTIELVRDVRTDQLPYAATLVFSLSIQNGIVSGRVWDGIDRRLLSTVNGTHQPLEASDFWFMALDFSWGNVEVALSGVTSETPDTVQFSGRYRARALVTATSVNRTQTFESSPPMGPGDGDTGSGTGQQT